MKDLILIALILIIIATAVIYIYHAKKKGKHCIGCPFAKECTGKCGGNCKEKDKQ